jgi:hypothetical protein
MLLPCLVASTKGIVSHHAVGSARHRSRTARNIGGEPFVMQLDALTRARTAWLAGVLGS